MTDLADPSETPEGHIAGYPVSLSTYMNRFCRCSGCRALNAEASRKRREGKARIVPEHGTISRYTSRTYKCRCGLCTAAQTVYRREQRAKKRAEEGKPPLPRRPPGMVWVDSSDYTHVVRCERCDKNYGPWLSKWEALTFQASHNTIHINAKEVMDWTKWSAERLIKNPGGRPPLEDKPLCTEELCTEDAHARGLCSTHYKRNARAQRAEVKDLVEFADKVRKTTAPPRVSKALCGAPMCGSRPTKGKYCEAHS